MRARKGARAFAERVQRQTRELRVTAAGSSGAASGRTVAFSDLPACHRRLAGASGGLSGTTVRSGSVAVRQRVRLGLAPCTGWSQRHRGPREATCGAAGNSGRICDKALVALWPTSRPSRAHRRRTRWTERRRLQTRWRGTSQRTPDIALLSRGYGNAKKRCPFEYPRTLAASAGGRRPVQRLIQGGDVVGADSARQPAQPTERPSRPAEARRRQPLLQEAVAARRRREEGAGERAAAAFERKNRGTAPQSRRRAFRAAAAHVNSR